MLTALPDKPEKPRKPLVYASQAEKDKYEADKLVYDAKWQAYTRARIARNTRQYRANKALKTTKSADQQPAVPIQQQGWNSTLYGNSGAPALLQPPTNPSTGEARDGLGLAAPPPSLSALQPPASLQSPMQLQPPAQPPQPPLLGEPSSWSPQPPAPASLPARAASVPMQLPSVRDGCSMTRAHGAGCNDPAIASSPETTTTTTMSPQQPAPLPDGSSPSSLSPTVLPTAPSFVVPAPISLHEKHSRLTAGMQAVEAAESSVAWMARSDGETTDAESAGESDDDLGQAMAGATNSSVAEETDCDCSVPDTMEADYEEQPATTSGEGVSDEAGEPQKEQQPPEPQAAYAVGEKIRGRWKATSLGQRYTLFLLAWYPGVVTAVHELTSADGVGATFTYDIDYDDGDSEQGVAEQFVKPPTPVAPPEPEVRVPYIPATYSSPLEYVSKRLGKAALFAIAATAAVAVGPGVLVGSSAIATVAAATVTATIHPNFAPAALAACTTIGDVFREVLPAYPRQGATRCKPVWTSTTGKSVMYQGVIDRAVVQAAMECIPRSVLCDKDATRRDLKQQMGRCNELDDIHFLKDGNGRGGRRVRLNSTDYPQPRRKSWSVRLDDGAVYDPEHGEWVTEMYSYSQAMRLPTDWRAAPMPKAIFELGVHCWRAAYPYLSEVSQACPPTGCQALFYHTTFNSTIGRHRDNGLLSVDDAHMTRLGHSEDENSQVHLSAAFEPVAPSLPLLRPRPPRWQIRGSCVMVYSEGPPMEFALMQPPAHKSKYKARKKDYIFNKANVVSLGSGTLYVLHPHDDEDFIHCAWFEAKVRAEAQSACRVAFAFRWLSKRHRFFASGKKVGALVPTDEILRQAKERKKAKARKSKRRWGP